MKNCMLVYVLALTLCFVIVGIQPAYANTYFEWQEIISDKTIPLQSISSGNGKYIAVGKKGVVKVSSDKSIWTELPAFTSSDLLDITYGTPGFVISSTNGIFFSTDGTSWKNVVSNSIWNAAAWNGKMYVAVGENGNAAISKDGLEWKVVKTTTKSLLTDITCNETQFTAVGDNAQFTYTTDGENWKEGKLEADNDFSGKLNAVFWDGKQFFATGQGCGILISSDASSWSAVPNFLTSYFLGHMTFDGKKYYFCSNWGGLIITDLALTSSVYSFTTGLALNDIFYDKTSLLGANQSGEVVTQNSDGSWNIGNRIFDGGFKKIATNGSAYVAVGHVNNGSEGYIWSSKDGKNFTQVSTDIKYPLMYDVIWDGKQFLAVGYKTIARSKDGFIWELTPNIENGLNAIAFNGSTYVAVGTGNLITSTDSIHWTEKSIHSDHLFGVQWLNNQFIAVGTSIQTSNDGENWVERLRPYEIPTYISCPSYVNDVAWNGTTYVAVTNYGKIYTSEDGIEWKLKDFKIPDLFTGICWDGKSFIVIGSRLYLDSLDGYSWSQHSLDKHPLDKQYLEDIIFSNGQYFAVGEPNRIVSAISKPTPTSQNILKGDVNNDGKINSDDYAMIQRYQLWMTPFTQGQLDAADINNDNILNSDDLALLKRHILKDT